jgi:deoxyadenosine/deoxycytidine kinase
MLFTIEGNIGAGKSTLIDHLRSIKTVGNRKLIFLPEPVDVWETIVDENGLNILQLFYADQVKYSFSFQMMTFISRYCLLESCLAANPDAVIVTERCLLTDYHVFAALLHETGCMSSVEYAIYKKWFERFNKFALSGIIYLNCSPEVALARCEKRNRAGETVDLAYLKLCHAKHDWIDYEPDVPLLVLDANATVSDEVLEDWVDEICLFMEEETVPKAAAWDAYAVVKTLFVLLPLLFYGHTMFYYGIGGN